MDTMTTPSVSTHTPRCADTAELHPAAKVPTGERTTPEILEADSTAGHPGADWVRDWYRQIFGIDLRIDLGGEPAGNPAREPNSGVLALRR